MAAFGNGSKMSWNPFSLFGSGSKAPERISNGPTLEGNFKPKELPDMKRRRDQGTEDEDESPGKKRARHESPPRTSGMPLSGPLRRSGSVKALYLHDGNARNRPMSSLRSEASFASVRSTLSRAPSTGLSMHINNLKLQTASPTPAPEWSNLSAPKAGVSRQSYNVAQPLGSADMSVDSTVDGSSRMSVQRGLTPTGATFGAMRTMLDNNSSNGTRNASRSPTSMQRPVNERHSSSGVWSSRSGSVKSPRFGDSSLSRNRTSSLLSVTASAYTASNTSANGEDRTTPTPTNDGGLSSPPVTSPATSSVGSPQPTSLALQAPGKPLSLQAQRAIEGLNVDTPLRHSLSFTRHAPMRKVKVPMPSKKSLSYGRSSDAGGSRHSQSQSESGDVAGKPAKPEIQGHQRAASGPYAFGRDKASSKKILDKRRAEEKKDLETQRSENTVMEEVDLHVEPIQKGKADVNQSDAVMQGENTSAGSKLAAAKTTANRLTPSIDSTSNSGTSSRTVGRSQLRVGREKTNHHQSASVTSLSTASQAPPPSTTTGRASSLAPSGLEDRTRIPLSEIPSRFNPKHNDRLNRAMSTGRFSLPPDDDDEDVGMASGSRGASRGPSQGREVQRPPTGPTLITDRLNGGDRDKTPERGSASEAMNISPVKESFKRTDSDASDMMSTTPTESSVRGAFSMTPIKQESSQAPILPSNPFAKADAPAAPASFGFTPVPAPASKPVEERKPSPFSFPIAPAPAEHKPSPFSFATAPTVESKPVSSPFSFATVPLAESKAPASSPFSFGPVSALARVVEEAPKPAASGFSFLPAPGTTKPATSGSTSGFTFPTLPSTTAFPPIAAEPAKRDALAASSPFSFGGAPLPTLSVSPPPQEAPKEAPKPFSFGSMAPAPLVEAKATPTPFSFGQPSVATTPKPSAAVPVSTTPATPSPVKPLFSFPSTTPAANPSTTPQSSPFSFGLESPSPVKAIPLGAPVELKTPTKDNTFSFGASTTPAATPIAQTGFSFGNPKSTTPAVTPSPAGFSFGAPTASSNSAAPFTFGAPPSASTTPAVTPIQTNGFSFAAGPGGNNPFASQTTPTANRGFNFGDNAAAPSSTTPSFSFGTPGDATPKGTHTPGGSFSFGTSPAPASNGFSFGAPASVNAGSAGVPTLVFPSGPTTPTAKLLELDSMDSSPIRGGVPATTNGSSFSAANTGSGFSFGSNSGGGGFGSNTAAPPLNSNNSGFGAQNGSSFGSGFGREASPAPSPSTFSFGGNNPIGSGPGGFGQPPASTPFGQNAPSAFGQNNGFSFSQPNSATSASPFNQAQALPSPALGGFGQLSSPASSPFLTPVGLGSANLFGAPQGQKRAAEDQTSDGGGERKIAPMPRSRKPKTEAEKRAALQRAHRG